MSRLYCCSVRSCFCLTLYNVHNIFTLSKGFQFVCSWCRRCAIYFVGFIYIFIFMITWDQVMLVQLAAQFFVL